MSAATKKKYVTQEFLEELVLPDSDRGQQIVQVIGPKGNNLHEVRSASSETFLVSMPPKFRKSIWIKRGDYVLVDPIAEGDKVRGEIVNIIRTKDQIAHIKQEGKWPAEFEKSSQNDSPKTVSAEIEDSDADSDDDFSDLTPNLNRANGRQPCSEPDSDSEESCEE